MDSLKNLPKSLPESTHEFDLDVNGEYSNRPHKGSFTSKILTLRDQALVSKHRAYLNGDIVQHLDLQTLRLHQMISYLKYALVEVPKWWREADLGYELLDMNVIEVVYNKTLDFEDQWMKVIWGENKVEQLKKEQSGESEANE